MSARRNDSKPLLNREGRTTLDEILDFGPDSTPPPSQDFAQRIQQIVKKLQEINARIDRLNEDL